MVEAGMSFVEWSEAKRFTRRLDWIELKLHQAEGMVKLAKQAQLVHQVSRVAQLLAKLHEVAEELDELTAAATVEARTRREPRPAAD
jgi:hypothetical protein